MACNGTDFEKLNRDVKNVIKSLVISCPSGVSIQQLQYEYKDMNGRPIPFRELGCASLEEYLYSIPDTCRIIGYGPMAMVHPVVTEKNRHLDALVTRQKAPKSNPRHRPKFKRPRAIIDNWSVKPPPPKNFVPFKLPYNPESEKIVINAPHDYILDQRRQNQRCVTKNQNSSHQRIEQPQPRVTNHCDTRISNNTNDIPQESQPSTSKSSYSPPVEEKVNQESVSSYRNVEFSDDDSDAELFEMDFSDEEIFDFQSDPETDLATSVKNLYVANSQGFAMSSPQIDSCEPDIEEPHISRVSKKVQEKLRILIKEHPEGIWCSKLLRLYEERFQMKLDPQNFGFSSVIQMCDDLKDIFHSVRQNRTDWKLYDKTKPLPNLLTIQDFSEYIDSLPYAQERRNTSEPALPVNMLFTPSNYAYPDNVMFPGEFIKRQWLVDNEQPDAYIGLLVAEVYDPSKFWIQLKGETTSEKLNKLMDDMQLFYVHKAKDLQLTELSVQIGLMCAAIFMNEYHRAIVIKIFDDQTIKVFFCDYGTVAQVHLRRTCLLSRDFSELPMQAIRARLANIIPIEQNTMWTRAASSCMLSLVTEKILIGQIINIDYEQEILDLIITDTSDPNVDIHINDTLVEKGFAILGTEAPLCTTSSAIIPNVHLYPAFEELENAIHPCVSDVVTMLKVGHTYETIFQGYFANSRENTFDYSGFQRSRPVSAEQDFSTNPDEIYDETNPDEVYDETNLEDEYQPEEIYMSPEKLTPNEHNLNLETRCESLSSGSELSVDVSNQEKSSQTEDVEETQVQPEISRSNNPPPGFENVQPQKIGNPLMDMIGKQKNSDPVCNPLMDMIRKHKSPEPVCNPLMDMIRKHKSPEPVYHANSLPTLIPNSVNYPLMNPTIHPNNMMLLSNPLLYNQLMINRQKEIYMMQQIKFLEIQEMEARRYHQQQQQLRYANYNQAFPSTSQQVPCDLRFFPNQHFYEANLHHRPVLPYNTAAPDIKRESYCPNLSNNQLPTNTFFNPNSLSSNANNTTYKDIDAISKQNEHICDRFVTKLKINDSNLHVLRIDGGLYVVSQEIVSNLLKSDLSWKKWTQSVDLDNNLFPNKLVNMMDHYQVYSQLEKFSIPGVNPPNNLGCNVRLTSLKHVPDLVERYGTNTYILSNLKDEIKFVTENPNAWKSLDPSSD